MSPFRSILCHPRRPRPGSPEDRFIQRVVDFWMESGKWLGVLALFSPMFPMLIAPFLYWLIFSMFLLLLSSAC